MKNLKILCCCGAGMGTCMILRAKVDKVMNKLKVPARITNESVAIGTTIYKQYDVVFCNRNLVSNFKEAEKNNVVVIGLENVTNLQEIEEKFLTSGIMSKAEE
jgi:galactitol-specific phosphotransferase system IIB component